MAIRIGVATQNTTAARRATTTPIDERIDASAAAFARNCLAPTDCFQRTRPASGLVLAEWSPPVISVAASIERENRGYGLRSPGPLVTGWHTYPPVPPGGQCASPIVLVLSPAITIFFTDIPNRA
jgi:hypothetical protein